LIWFFKPVVDFDPEADYRLAESVTMCIIAAMQVSECVLDVVFSGANGTTEHAPPTLSWQILRYWHLAMLIFHCAKK
jgi:hypothetical protein